MTIVVFAYVLAMQEGVINRKKITIKKYINGKSYLAMSIFRKGYEIIQNKIQTTTDLIKYTDGTLTSNGN